jgi:hypothetical protein
MRSGQEEGGGVPFDDRYSYPLPSTSLLWGGGMPTNGQETADNRGSVLGDNEFPSMWTTLSSKLTSMFAHVLG